MIVLKIIVLKNDCIDKILNDTFVSSLLWVNFKDLERYFILFLIRKCISCKIEIMQQRVKVSSKSITCAIINKGYVKMINS